MAPQIWPAALTLLTLALLLWVAGIVGHYRGKYGIAAPAVTGNPHFERAYRVQMNTIENTLVFLPALWLAALWGSSTVVAACGLLWLVGRIVYALAYLKDPATRSLGFGISSFASVVLMGSAAYGLVRVALAGA